MWHPPCYNCNVLLRLEAVWFLSSDILGDSTFTQRGSALLYTTRVYDTQYSSSLIND